MLRWRSPFELEPGEMSPAEVLGRVREARRGRLRGLRVRIRGEEIRARHVVVEAAAASLLVARPVQRGSRTYLVGQMHWAAMFASVFIKGIGPALCGVGLVVRGLVDRTWQGVALGAVLAVTLGWASIYLLRTTREDQDLEEALIRESLRNALSS